MFVKKKAPCSFFPHKKPHNISGTDCKDVRKKRESNTTCEMLVYTVLCIQCYCWISALYQDFPKKKVLLLFLSYFCVLALLVFLTIKRAGNMRRRTTAPARTKTNAQNERIGIEIKLRLKYAKNEQIKRKTKKSYWNRKKTNLNE